MRETGAITFGGGAEFDGNGRSVVTELLDALEVMQKKVQFELSLPPHAVLR